MEAVDKKSILWVIRETEGVREEREKGRKEIVSEVYLKFIGQLIRLVTWWAGLFLCFFWFFKYPNREPNPKNFRKIGPAVNMLVRNGCGNLEWIIDDGLLF